MKETEKIVSILGYDVFSGDLKTTGFIEKMMINTINPHSFCVAQEDVQFNAALKRSDILLPDGIGIVFAAKILKGKRISKIAGADLHKYCLEQASKEGKSVFYLGASPETLQKIRIRLEHEFPNVKAGFYSPPFKNEFSDLDNQEMIHEVNVFQPDILFVGMTAPKQEKWIYEHFNQLQVSTTCAIGAVFDFYAGTVKRPHPFWIKLGLEWFIRFLKEPRRLFKRNFVSTPCFLMHIIKSKISFKTKNA